MELKVNVGGTICTSRLLSKVSMRVRFVRTTVLNINEGGRFQFNNTGLLRGAVIADGA